MSHISDFFACSCRVNSCQPAVCMPVTLLSAVSRVRLPSFLIPTAMSDSQSLNTSLLEVMISSKNEHVIFRDLSDLTLPIVVDGWWASMNVGLKHSIAWKNSRHASSWWCHSHCRIVQTGCLPVICIVSHQALRHPSEHATSLMGQHLLAKAHIAKFNQCTESEVTELTCSTVNETVFAILKRQGSRGITIAILLRMFIFDIPVKPYWLNWQTTRSKLAGMDFETSEFHQGTWIRYLMLGFVSAYIPWNTILNPKLWQSYKALHSDPVLPSSTTLNNICRREYALTVDMIMK